MKTGNELPASHLNSYLIRPIQMVPEKDKDLKWYADNMNWLEWKGYEQLRYRSIHMLRNYKLVAGVIDKSDYVLSEDNEYKSILDTLFEDDYNIQDIKFYPIIPTVINNMLTVFRKIKQEVIYKAVDEFSTNEYLTMRQESLKSLFMESLRSSIINEMVKNGILKDVDSSSLKSIDDYIAQLPSIEEFFRKGFRLTVEQWADKMHRFDSDRFRIDELESEGFRDLLANSCEFFHFNMYDSDYSIELWNPLFTFYGKKPSSPYISEGEYVGRFDVKTVSEVIDLYGRYMTEEQIKGLEKLMVTGTRNVLEGYLNDGSLYDYNLGSELNSMKYGGVDFRRLSYWLGGTGVNTNDIVNMLFSESEDGRYNMSSQYVRVTTAYWKTYRRIGFLTRIDDSGVKTSHIVDEDYKVTLKPVYNTSFYNEKSERTLIYGEHIEWTWVPAVVGAVKISPNNFNILTPSSDNTFPIVIGINRKEPGYLPYQIKYSSDNIYGVRLPVEGIVYTERNVKSHSLVDAMKPFQIAYNIVCNQIMDLLIDEIGDVVLLEQNMLPKHSLGEYWSDNPYMNAYVSMRKFKILGVDSSISNIQNPINFNHFQVLNLENTARIKSRVELAEFFKMQALESIGLTREMLYGSVSQYQSGSSVNRTIAQTSNNIEKYYTVHCDYLMPRVHEMRTTIAQYYVSRRKKSKVLSVINKDYEKELFGLIPDDILLRDLAVYAVTKVDYRILMEQLKAIVSTNPNLGLGLKDLIDIMSARTYSDLVHKIESMEEEKAKAIQSQMKEEERKYNQAIDLLMREKLLDADIKKQLEELKYRREMALKELELKYKNDSENVKDSSDDKYRYKLEAKDLELRGKERLKMLDYEIAKINNQDNK